MSKPTSRGSRRGWGGGQWGMGGEEGECVGVCVCVCVCVKKNKKSYHQSTADSCFLTKRGYNVFCHASVSMRHRLPCQRAHTIFYNNTKQRPPPPPSHPSPPSASPSLPVRQFHCPKPRQTTEYHVLHPLPFPLLRKEGRSGSEPSTWPLQQCQYSHCDWLTAG